MSIKEKLGKKIALFVTTLSGGCAEKVMVSPLSPPLIADAKK
jgi:flagellar motor component MotA